MMQAPLSLIPKIHVPFVHLFQLQFLHTNSLLSLFLLCGYQTVLLWHLLSTHQHQQTLHQFQHGTPFPMNLWPFSITLLLHLLPLLAQHTETFIPRWSSILLHNLHLQCQVLHLSMLWLINQSARWQVQECLGCK